LPSLNKNLIFVSTLFLTILTDQWSKIFAIHNFQEKKEIIPDFFAFTLQANKGIAFSITFNKFLIIIFSSLLLILVFFLSRKYLKFEYKTPNILIPLIIGGGISNLIDRIRLGSVIDFISISKYPIFNLADVFITIGCIILLLISSKFEKKHHD